MTAQLKRYGIFQNGSFLPSLDEAHEDFSLVFSART
jgi:hypothetical protein